MIFEYDQRIEQYIERGEVTVGEEHVSFHAMVDEVQKELDRITKYF